MEILNFLKKIRRFVIRFSFKFYNPFVIKKIGGFELKMKRSHMLPHYLRDLPFYDRALPRICSELSSIKKIKVIDVGANIGDTVALISEKSKCDFLCIDGDNDYFKLLEENTKNIPGKIICLKHFLGDTSKLNNLKVFSINGTARLVNSDDKNKLLVKTVTLDSLLKNYPYFENSDLIKVDTDGFELNVFNGAKKFLKRSKPVVFLEFTPNVMCQFNQNPFDLLDLFFSLGYEDALFYLNTGEAKELVSLNNKKRIDELISLIDFKKICYYDILLVHKSSKNKNILKKELNYFKDKIL